METAGRASVSGSATTDVDVLIVGAGASGLMCAIEAGKRGRSVVVLDHARTLAEKIRISGGGRCNFTHLHVRPENYLSDNPHFCRSALAGFSPQDFLGLLKSHRLNYCEKAAGQLFCAEGAGAIIDMLQKECRDAGARVVLSCEIEQIERTDRFKVATQRGHFRAESLVIASGGLSIPKIGASPFGYKVAEQFGIPVTRLHAGLVPLSVHPEAWADYAELTGISVEATVRCGKQSFHDEVLFTHRGLSGPAILQISSYWTPGTALHIDWLPGRDFYHLLNEASGGRMALDNFLAQHLPRRMAERWCAKFSDNRPLNQLSDKNRRALAAQLHDWQITPSGTLGYNKAEVTCGGIDTRALSSKTLQANAVPGLYFVGEVVDVTGQLGGYNLQWAWASGAAAGRAA